MDNSMLLDHIQGELLNYGSLRGETSTIEPLGLGRDDETLFSVVNPRPSVDKPFSLTINVKHSPLLVFTLTGTVETHHLDNLRQRLTELLLFNNDGHLKYKLVFDLKKVNFLDLNGLCTIYNIFTLIDPLGGSISLNNIDRICFLQPTPDVPEHKEVVTLLRLAFIGFGELREKDKRYWELRVKFVSRNRDVDAFMKLG
jgi:anti-anti-sigma regulatory factor